MGARESSPRRLVAANSDLEVLQRRHRDKYVKAGQALKDEIQRTQRLHDNCNCFEGYSDVSTPSDVTCDCVEEETAEWVRLNTLYTMNYDLKEVAPMMDALAVQRGLPRELVPSVLAFAYPYTAGEGAVRRLVKDEVAWRAGGHGVQPSPAWQPN